MPTSNFPYKAAFEALQVTLHSISTVGPEVLTAALDKYRREPAQHIVDTDEALFRNLVMVIFYAGMTAKTVTDRRECILAELGDADRTAKFTEADIQRLLGMDGMLRNRARIKACVQNARTFVRLREEHGTVANYLNRFGPYESQESFSMLLAQLQKDFVRFRHASAYHFAMELWLNNVKPDRVLQRVFYRLGLTGKPQDRRPKADQEAYLWSFTTHARAFAKATGHSVRYVDISFMALGQKAITEFGVTGTCLEEEPQCGRCKLRPFCQFARERAGAEAIAA